MSCYIYIYTYSEEFLRCALFTALALFAGTITELFFAVLLGISKGLLSCQVKTIIDPQSIQEKD